MCDRCVHSLFLYAKESLIRIGSKGSLRSAVGYPVRLLLVSEDFGFLKQQNLATPDSQVPMELHGTPNIFKNYKLYQVHGYVIHI